MVRIFAKDVVLSLLPAVAGVAGLAIYGALRSPDDIPRVTQDIFITAKFNSLTGLMSNLGAFLWLGTGSVLAFAAAILRLEHRHRQTLFLALAAALTLYLWFDDFFMFHEALAPHLLGIDEKLVYATIGLLAATYLWLSRAEILRTQYVWLMSAMGCLGLSVAWDLVSEMLPGEPGGWNTWRRTA